MAVREFRARERIPTLSEAARRLVTGGLRPAGPCYAGGTGHRAVGERTGRA